MRASGFLAELGSVQSPGYSEREKKGSWLADGGVNELREQFLDDLRGSSSGGFTRSKRKDGRFRLLDGLALQNAATDSLIPRQDDPVALAASR